MCNKPSALPIVEIKAQTWICRNAAYQVSLGCMGTTARRRLQQVHKLNALTVAVKLLWCIVTLMSFKISYVFVTWLVCLRTSFTPTFRHLYQS